MGEHSPVDALIPSVMVDYVLAEPVNEHAFASSGSGKAETKGWGRLDWMVDDAIKQEVDECQKRNQKLIDDSDASQLWWGEYGAEWIKKSGMSS